MSKQNNYDNFATAQRKRNRNRSSIPSPPAPAPPPPHTFGSSIETSDSQRRRKIRNVISATDHAELQKHYTFVVPSDDNNNNNTSSSSSSCWQDRMVQYYHSHLYKEYVLADMSRVRTTGQLGLRWRTQDEVQSGRGHITCGNKHCPAGGSRTRTTTTTTTTTEGTTTPQVSREVQQQQQDVLVSNYLQWEQLPNTNKEEEGLLSRVPYGLGLYDYEVPFTYVEHNVQRTELVKLRLCLRCAPLVFKGKDAALDARKARNNNNNRKQNHNDDSNHQEEDVSLLLEEQHDHDDSAHHESTKEMKRRRKRNDYSSDSHDGCSNDYETTSRRRRHHYHRHRYDERKKKRKKKRY